MHITEKKPCPDTAGRWPRTSQEERSHQKPALWAPWPWASSLQNYEKINFCCLSHWVCGILLQQPEQTNINHSLGWKWWSSLDCHTESPTGCTCKSALHLPSLSQSCEISKTGSIQPKETKGSQIQFEKSWLLYLHN